MQVRPIRCDQLSEGVDVGQWWYNLRTQKVEPDEGGPNAERLGPFDTEEEAAQALETAAKRNEEWDAGENEWDGERPRTDGVIGVEESGEDDN